MIICQGGRFDGWSLYFKNGRPMFTYNRVGLKRYSITANQPTSAGKAVIRFDFTTDGGRLGAGGDAALFVNDAKVAQGRIDNTNALMFSADEGADVGVDEGAPVTEDDGVANTHFTGQIERVTIAVEPIGPNIKDKVDKAAQQMIIDEAAAE